MCTVSWVEGPDGYDLLCNRDEKRSRGIAEPPRVNHRERATFRPWTVISAGRGSRSMNTDYRCAS